MIAVRLSHNDDAPALGLHNVVAQSAGNRVERQAIVDQALDKLQAARGSCLSAATVPYVFVAEL